MGKLTYVAAFLLTVAVGIVLTMWLLSPHQEPERKQEEQELIIYPTPAQTQSSSASRQMFLYLLDNTKGEVIRLNLQTKEQTPIAVGREPIDMVHDAKKIYVLNKRSQDISIIDHTTMQLARTIPLDDQATSLAIQGKSIYLAVPAEQKILVMSVDGYKEQDIPLDHAITALVKDDVSGNILGIHPDGDAVSIINPNINAFLNDIDVGKQPEHLAITQAGDLIFVANTESLEISVIPMKLKKEGSRIPVKASISDLIVTRDNRFLYVLNPLEETISVISLALEKVVQTIDSGQGAKDILYEPEQQLIYAANSIDQTITVIDERTLKIKEIVPLAYSPMKMILIKNIYEIT